MLAWKLSNSVKRSAYCQRKGMVSQSTCAITSSAACFCCSDGFFSGGLPWRSTIAVARVVQLFLRQRKAVERRGRAVDRGRNAGRAARRHASDRRSMSSGIERHGPAVDVLDRARDQERRDRRVAAVGVADALYAAGHGAPRTFGEQPVGAGIGAEIVVERAVLLEDHEHIFRVLAQESHLSTSASGAIAAIGRYCSAPTVSPAPAAVSAGCAAAARASARAERMTRLDRGRFTGTCSGVRTNRAQRKRKAAPQA